MSIRNCIQVFAYVEPCEFCNGTGIAGYEKGRAYLCLSGIRREPDIPVRCHCGSGKWMVYRDDKGEFVARVGIS